MLWTEIRMTAESVAGALDMHDDSVVQEPVQKGRCEDWIAEDLAPFSEAAV